MTVLQAVALAVAVVATLDALRLVTGLGEHYTRAIAGEAGKRTQRLALRRMGRTVIRYQAGVGVACLLLGAGAPERPRCSAPR